MIVCQYPIQCNENGISLECEWWCYRWADKDEISGDDLQGKSSKNHDKSEWYVSSFIYRYESRECVWFLLHYILVNDVFILPYTNIYWNRCVVSRSRLRVGSKSISAFTQYMWAMKYVLCKFKHSTCTVILTRLCSLNPIKCSSSIACKNDFNKWMRTCIILISVAIK